LRRRGEDLFGLAAHFSAWCAADLGHVPLFMLRYERMFDEDVAQRLFELLSAHKLPPQQVGECYLRQAARALSLRDAS
jgi:hypothetical protein